MKKSWNSIILLPIVLLNLTGCAAIGNKTTSLSFIYGAFAIFSFFLLISCIFILRNKNIWFLLLFSSVFLVNTGYYILSVSDTLSRALMANRLSYFGSVFLLFSMLMIILSVTKLHYPRWLPKLLLCISLLVFLITASPGYLDIYYKEVTLTAINGVTILNKVYGPWHSLYLYYLLLYFASMVGVVIYAVNKHKMQSPTHSLILIIAVFANIIVWLIEQLVSIHFEYLSVSYIITELFLIALYMIMQETERLLNQTPAPDPVLVSLSQDNEETKQVTSVSKEKCTYFTEHLPDLTPAERNIYGFYLEGRTTKEIMQELNITENTLKYHNKNLYSKLGVSSRKQLMEIAKIIQKTQ